MWIDTHCHLDFELFDPERDQIVETAQALGIEQILIPGVVADGWQGIHTLADTYDQFLLPAYGMHPCFCARHKDEHLASLDEWLGVCRPVAVGEIGLDFFIENPDEPRQIELFSEQVRIARQHELPIVVHCRKAHDQCLKIIRDLRFEFGGFMHAFSGSLQQARKAVDLGFKLGVGGAATYERATKLHKLLNTLPLSSFVLETDAPDIPPSFARDKPNTPLNIPRIAQLICRNAEIDPVEFAETTTRNALTVLRMESVDSAPA